MTENKRTSAVQLPDLNELISILDKEAKRKPAPGKEKLFSPNFGTVEDWVRSLGIETDIFSGDRPWQELLVRWSELEPEVVAKTLEGGNNPEILERLKRVTEYLGEADTPQKADLIFVFGSQSLARIQTAVDLWKQGIAPRVFITGAHPNYQVNPKSEAEIFREYAIGAGVPSEAIITESNAITVADNVRRSLNMFDEQGIKYGSMVLVTAWFAQRRSWAHMMKYVPTEAKLYRVNAPVTATGPYTQEGWFRNENGIKVVFNEFGKMKAAVSLNTA